MAVRGGRANWWKLEYKKEATKTVISGFVLFFLAALSAIVVLNILGDTALFAAKNHSLLTPLGTILFAIGFAGAIMAFWGIRMDLHTDRIEKALEEEAHQPQDKPKAPRHTHWWHGV